MEYKKRNIKFDVLRIIAMLMIIMHHCIINDFGLQKILNGTDYYLSTKQTIVLIFLNSIVIIGVNLFFLISGYFKIKFNLKKFIKIIFQIYIVYDIVTLLGIWTNHIVYDSDVLMDLINPIQKYWFLCAYLGLYIFSPFLNKAIENTTKKEAIFFLIFSILIFSLYAFRFDNGLIIGNGYSLIWAIIMYFIGGFIEKFDFKIKKIGILFITMPMINSILVWYLYNKGPVLNINAWGIYRYNNVLVYLQSLGLFIFFNSLNINIKNKKVTGLISFLATSTLMTYLLHSTCWLTYFRGLPIKELINTGKFNIGIIMLPLYALFIFILCSLVSKIYDMCIIKIEDGTIRFFRKRKKR